jgi:hypothetical protein
MNDQNFIVSQTLTRIEEKLDAHIEASGAFRESVAVIRSQKLDKRISVIESTNQKRVGFASALGALSGGGATAIVLKFLSLI